MKRTKIYISLPISGLDIQKVRAALGYADALITELRKAYQKRAN